MSSVKLLKSLTLPEAEAQLEQLEQTQKDLQHLNGGFKEIEHAEQYTQKK